MQSIEDVQEELRPSAKGKPKGDLEIACRKMLEKSANVVRPGELQALVKRVEVIESKIESDREYVINTDTLCAHKVHLWSSELKPSEWRTVCNWDFGHGKESYEWLKSVEGAKTCDRCWRRIECDKGNLRRNSKKNKAEVEDSGSVSSEPEDEWVAIVL